mgnify:CR=1 FL=1
MLDKGQACGILRIEPETEQERVLIARLLWVLRKEEYVTVRVTKQAGSKRLRFAREAVEEI